MFTRDEIAPNYRVFSLCCPLRSFHWWVGSEFRPDVCLQPTAGATVGLVCVIIFPYPRGKSHFGVVLAPAGAAYTLPAYGTALDGLLPKSYWREQVYRRTQVWVSWC